MPPVSFLVNFSLGGAAPQTPGFWLAGQSPPDPALDNPSNSINLQLGKLKLSIYFPSLLEFKLKISSTLDRAWQKQARSSVELIFNLNSSWLLLALASFGLLLRLLAFTCFGLLSYAI